MPPPSSWPTPPTTPSPSPFNDRHRLPTLLPTTRAGTRPQRPAQPRTVKAESPAPAKPAPPQPAPPPRPGPAGSAGAPPSRSSPAPLHSSLVIAAAVGISALGKHRPSGVIPDIMSPASRRPMALRSCCRSPASSYPRGVAVDSAGTVYVTDRDNNRVLKLAAGSSTQDRAAVHRPQHALRCGGGQRRHRLRHRHQQQPGAEAGGGLVHPDGAAVHRPQRPPRCGGGHRRHRLRRRRSTTTGC